MNKNLANPESYLVKKPPTVRVVLAKVFLYGSGYMETIAGRRKSAAVSFPLGETGGK
jgi:hypothetical protein